MIGDVRAVVPASPGCGHSREISRPRTSASPDAYRTLMDVSADFVLRKQLYSRRSEPLDDDDDDVTSASLLSVFKNRLKTYLFRRCYETV